MPSCAAAAFPAHAAVGLAEWLSITHGDQGIKVSVLCPQAVRTAMTASNPDGVASVDGMMEPEELAGEFPELTNRMRATVISLVLNLKMQILALADTVVTEIGNATMNPEVIEDYEKWLDEYHKGDEKILPG